MRLAFTVVTLALASTRGIASPVGIESGQESAVVPSAPEWWRKAGDPVLAILVQQGLDSSPEIGCSVARLQQYHYQLARDAKKIGARLGRLLGADQKTAAKAQVQAHEARVQRIAEQRVRLARQIMLAYIEVRRLQAEVALRSSLQGQYKDNAEVARFRREAGLVSAIDGALARTQDEAAQGELAFATGRLADATSELARLVGDTPEALSGKLGAAAPATAPLTASQADAIRDAAQDAPGAALAAAVLRETRLVQALEEARRTVRDARGAYRQGAGDFATVYVAEAAVAAVNLALINARAARMTATLDVSSGKDIAWARQGLEPMSAAGVTARDQTITVIADCE